MEIDAVNTVEKKVVEPNSLKAWWLAARPKTLSGAAVPVLIGVALAWADASETSSGFSFFAASLCFLFAFVMQIDANFVNDLFDFLSGTDDKSVRLGPPRACSEGWITPKAMKIAIAVTTVVACMCGLPLVCYGGWEMIVVGVLCVAFCFLYTSHLAGLGLGDVLVLVFFGVVPVCLTYYLQMHTCTSEVVLMSIACGLVIDGLLIVNNFRDRDTDRNVGKCTLVVRLGAEQSLWLYLALGVFGSLCGLVFITTHPFAFILPLVYLAMHVATYCKMRRIGSGKALNECLADTARNILVYGVTVAIGLLL